MTTPIIDPESAITPHRSTLLTLDTPETSIVERGIRVLRRGPEVAKRAVDGTAKDAEHLNVTAWGSGAWTLSPIQSDIANLHESTLGTSLVITGWSFVQTTGPSGNQSIMQSMPNWAQSTLPGASYSGSVPSSGDPFYRKRIPATGSADPAANSANVGFDSTRPGIPYSNTDIPMDRIGVSTATCSYNQGFFLRWRAPGTLLSYPRYLFAFHFGQYALVVGGSGLCELWEYCPPAVGAYRWVKRDFKWRYAPEGTAPGTAHSIAIFPHQGYDGNRFIEFANISSASAPKTGTADIANTPNSAVGSRVYRIDSTVRGSDVDVSPGYVTSSDKVRIDIRRDLKLDLQASLLGFQTGGTLLDDPTIAGGGAFTGNTNTVNITILADQPSGTSITATVINPDTGAAFTPGTDLFPGAKFVFAGDGTTTPVLWGYTIKQDDVTATATPGSFSLAGRSYEITDYSGDPQTETASVNAVDLTMAHTRLTKRGRFSALLATTYTPPGGAEKTVRLFQGVARRPRGVRHGVPHGGYPADDWREYNLTMAGMWDRLNERVQPPIMRTYAVDPSITSSVNTWKVTDALVDMIMSTGFVSSQINIPDLNYRLWPGYTAKVDDLTIAPASSIAEMAVRMLREHLGAFLHWEKNSSSDGQWILIFGTQPAGDGMFTPVWNFVQDTPVYPNAPYHPASYATNTSFYRDKPDMVVIPPDFNMVEVTTGTPTTTAYNRMQIASFAYNMISFPVPGSTVTPDPDHPDWIGHCVPLEIIAPHLECGSYSDTVTAVQWTARRYYDFLCHTQRIQHIEAPLGIIYDETLAGSSSGGYRPLRFQDPVSLDGDNTWLIKSMRPRWSSDRVMMCDYELIQPFSGQHFFGADGREEERRTIRRMVQRQAGFGSRSAMYTPFAPSSHREQAHLELPYVRQGFGAIQAADGSFNTMTGWHTQTQTDG